MVKLIRILERLDKSEGYEGLIIVLYSNKVKEEALNMWFAS